MFASSHADFSSGVEQLGTKECFAEGFYGHKQSELGVLCIQSRDVPICVALSPHSTMFATCNDEAVSRVHRVFYTPVGDMTLR